MPRLIENIDQAKLALQLVNSAGYEVIAFAQYYYSDEYKTSDVSLFSKRDEVTMKPGTSPFDFYLKDTVAFKKYGSWAMALADFIFSLPKFKYRYTGIYVIYTDTGEVFRLGDAYIPEPELTMDIDEEPELMGNLMIDEDRK